ncbi:MAG: hypothetical protein AMXMBFR72_03660 [Betaproteobacteria bacterium]
MLCPSIAPSARRREGLPLGMYPEVGLKAARAKRDEARALLRGGKDPGVIRATEKTRAKHDAANTFEARDAGPGGMPARQTRPANS